MAVVVLSPLTPSSAQESPPTTEAPSTTDVPTTTTTAPGTTVPGDPGAEAATAGTPFTSDPESGPTGTRIEVAGEGCLLPGTDVPGEGVVVRLKSQGQVVGFRTILVDPDGSWAGTLEVLAGTPQRVHRLEARCVYPDEPDPVVYTANHFEVTGEGPNAEVGPAGPRFNGGIEPFPEYDGQSTCSPNTKPGMARFMRIVYANFGGGSLGVGRACGVGGQSEHKEGRAWDWANDVGSAADRARVNRFFNWLFATDAQCNAYAVARRIGIMYMIWNHRMFRMYDVNRGWAPYSGSNPHTNHVHISLTRDGGAGRVSYYNPTYRAAPGWTPGRHRVRDQNVGTRWDGIEPLSGDFDGDGFDDLLWYDPTTGPAVVWYSLGDGRFRGTTVAMGAGRIPLVGDFNGDCKDDIVWYGPGEIPDRKWQGKANRTFRSIALDVNATYEHQIVGDFDGNRVSDIYWYNPGAGADQKWLGTIYGFVQRDATQGGDFEPIPGDFDGDFRDDILWYGPGAAPDRLWYGRANGGFAGHKVRYAGDRIPVPGDYNGDDRTDILWYGVGDVPDRIWTGRPIRGFKGYAVTADRPYASAVAADIDGDTFDDLFWHDSPVHGDRIWWF